MYHIIADAGIFEQVWCFLAMLVRIKLKIDIMQQTYDGPVLCVVTEALFLREPPHDTRYRQPVLYMKWLLILFFQQFKCLII